MRTEAPTPTIEDELFEAQGCDFVIRWTAEHEYRVLFEVFEVVARTLQPDNVMLGPPEFTRAGSDDAFNTTTRVEDVAVIITGGVKFDGCSHVDVHDQLHLCGWSCWQGHVELMAHLWARAHAKVIAPNGCDEQHAKLTLPG